MLGYIFFKIILDTNLFLSKMSSIFCLLTNNKLEFFKKSKSFIISLLSIALLPSISIFLLETNNYYYNCYFEDCRL